jgi:hypothetical protein
VFNRDPLFSNIENSSSITLEIRNRQQGNTSYPLSRASTIRTMYGCINCSVIARNLTLNAGDEGYFVNTAYFSVLDNVEVTDYRFSYATTSDGAGLFGSVFNTTIKRLMVVGEVYPPLTSTMFYNSEVSAVFARARNLRVQRGLIVINFMLGHAPWEFEYGVGNGIVAGNMPTNNRSFFALGQSNNCTLKPVLIVINAPWSLLIPVFGYSGIVDNATLNRLSCATYVLNSFWPNDIKMFQAEENEAALAQKTVIVRDDPVITNLLFGPLLCNRTSYIYTRFDELTRRLSLDPTKFVPNLNNNTIGKAGFLKPK